MKRRNFLNFLGIGAASAALGAHKLLGELIPTPAPVIESAVIGEYVDYCSVTSLDLAQVIYFDKPFLANLKAATPFVSFAEGRALPVASGEPIRFFQYSDIT